MRDDLFTVVHEQFFTDTTDYADYILPATTFLEHTDVQGAYGHYFVQLSKQAIEPPGEARLECVALRPACAAHGIHRSLLPRYAGRDDPAGARDRRRRPLEEREHGAHYIRRSGARRAHSARVLFRSREASVSAVHFRLGANAFRQNRIFLGDSGRSGRSTGFRLLFRRSNRAGAKRRKSIRWNCWGAKTTTT